ncbi:NAD/NADP-dependent octopine/nopaline dehydrogenase family protein [Anaerotignum sp.]|uniref:NAD/NADP-dependent octopine/nopaline dehydrogenase family protein n=1 Tax=Anaerotignum sp. TaxID=2039241 RepID=UPI0028AD36AD|nr:NAD/NADP octopine/nopaline dehydrogenase family protein [Anaerotignum sp.]
MIKKVCIIGGGNGAFASAADLTLRGYEVTIFEESRFASNIEKIQKTGVIHLEGVGPVGDAKIHKITTDLADALSDVDIVMPISPAYAQETVAKMLAPYVKEGMVICLTPGSCGGSLVYAKVFNEEGVVGKVKLCEMNTLPYATRKVSDDTVRILLETKLIYFAAFPSKYNQELFDLVKPLYPALELVTDVLESALNNGNVTSHPTPVVLNAGKIEYYGKHFHYKEGITPSVARVNWKVDEERLDLCDAFGYKRVDALERLYLTGYCPKADNLYDAYQGSKGIFLDIEGPNDLSGRYLTEDAPCSLVFCANLGRAAGVETPVMDSVTVLASALRDENYWETGRTLAKVGLEGKNVQQILEFLKEGYK